MRTARVYRAVVPPEAPVTERAWSVARVLILIVVVMFIVIPALRWLGEQRVQRTITQSATIETTTQATTQPVQSTIGPVSRYEYEHQRCENLGYNNVVFEERPYGWYVTCTE
jgi:cytochrome oxidase assembly protein ShyY1